MSFFEATIPEFSTPSISWSIKEHKMVEESKKNKIYFNSFSDKIREMEHILEDVPTIARDIERAYFPRLFGSSLWNGFMPGQIVFTGTDIGIGLGEWITATTAGTVTATASGSPDRVIGRVMGVDHEIEHGGKITTKAKIQLRR